jgi:hypothetical protein
VSALILACATVAVLLRGGDKNGDPIRLECVDPLVCGELALQPVSQWTATASATAEPRGDASPQSESSESPGARKLDAGPARSPGDPQGGADLGPGSAPGRDAGGTALLGTHYGGGPAWGDAVDYNGGWLGCGLFVDEDGNNLYSSDDPTIAATGYGSPWGCGTELILCGPVGCQGVIVQDRCPGCGPGLVDLSEMAHQRVCGYGTCEVSVSEP